MKNKIFNFITILIFSVFIIGNTNSAEQFNFDVTEIEIVEKGNLFIGQKRGTITTNEGLIIIGNEFEYNKSKNILNVKGDVSLENRKDNIILYSDKITYLKNDEIIFTTGNSQAIYENITINSETFKYEKNLNILNASGKVEVIDKVKDQKIFAEKIIYKKNQEIISTSGKTEAIIESKYNLLSEDVTLIRNQSKLNSKKETIVKDKFSTIYKLDNFQYLINKKELRGKNILIITDFGLPQSDKFFFKSAIIDLDKKNFIAKDTKIHLHNDILGEANNNPRIYGVSSSKNNNITTVNKGIFTSCKKNDSCPAWSISANKIEHDKTKKIINYENAILKIYDFPILYFPKFFHPDPSVVRQSGFLQPQINSSNVLGESIYIPYFKVISRDKDFTFRPTFFENNMQMLRNEYRQQNENSSFIADFSLTKGYKSSNSKSKNSITHLFAKYKSDLKLENFLKSDFYLSLQKVSNDTYLKVFDTNLIDTESEIKPKNKNSLTSELKLSLEHENFEFNSGFQAFENLQKGNSDRFQYILPYYDFTKNLSQNFFNGEVNLRSNGDNNYKNTNNVQSRIINDLEYKSYDLISNFGTKNNYNIFFKNSGTVGKKDNKYKSSPQIEIMNILEINSSMPLKKQTENHNNFITPKVSFRINPSDMKNYSDTKRKINTDNIFDINRLGLVDTYESGKSLTMGVDYKKENLNDINNYFEFKIASLIRDKEEKFIPSSSSLNKTNSNLFGTIRNKFSDNFEVDYEFILDNNYEKFEYNSISTSLNFNNFETNFNFVEENGNTGNTNFLENTTSYNFDDSNSIIFSTRRNRKLNLTEFYNLVYEYKNDCLIANIKYNKTYYNDRDLKPTENLLFSITLYPITTYEHNMDRNSYDRLRDAF